MNVAFIPVRGGSKSIPLKNIRLLNGKPLVYWTVNAANYCKDIDAVYVATDSDEIRKVVNGFGLEKVKVIDRSEETATDTASTELAMLEFAHNYEFDNIALIQATSPLLKSLDLEAGFNLYQSADSVLSVVRQKRFIWANDENGNVVPKNYDPLNRPRRQCFDGYLVENGAFYITSKERLLNTKNRISGNIKAYEMCEESYLEIDEPSDWTMIEQIMKRYETKFDVSNIKMILTDSDGCLTDAGMYYSENGDELKKFSAKDGLALGIFMKNGIITGIITGETRELIRRRAEKMDINELYMGIKDKMVVIKELANKYNLDLSQIAYIGDDLNDLECIKECGFSACPADASKVIRENVDYVCKRNGGEGVIRELLDEIFKLW